MPTAGWRTAADGRTRLAAIAMGLQGLLVLTTWVGFIARGVFEQGVKTVENNMYLGFHVLAEAAMGMLLLAGGWASFVGRAWGRPVGLLGLGAIGYSTVNSLGHCVRNDRKLTPVLLVNLAIAVAAAALLIGGGRAQGRHR